MVTSEHISCSDCTPYSDRAIIEATKKECERHQLALRALRDSEDLACSSQENTIQDETNENSSNIGNSPPDVSIPYFVLLNIFIYNELALIICLSYMQLKKIVASIIQSHKNEVARDVKIMIDRRFDV
jgi:hypothetical protein